MRRYQREACFLAGLLLLCCCVALPVGAQEAEQDEAQQQDEPVYHGTYYEQEQLNAGLPNYDMSGRLRTPQAALEHFVLSARAQDFQAAAHALNLALIPFENQQEQAPVLARHLYYLLQQHALIDWDTLPDRPDGQIDTVSAQEQNPLVGVPRRNIRLGDIALQGRNVPIRIQRVKTEDQSPVWVFSASTVEHITPLYNQYSPGFLAEQMPNWARVEFAGDVQLWEWGVMLLLILVSGSLGILVRQSLKRTYSNSADLWRRGLTDTVATPAALLGSLLLLFISARSLLALSGSITRFFDYTMVILLIIAGTWLVMRIIKFITDYVIEQHVLNQTEKDIEHARKLSTNLFVGRRVVLFLALLGGTVLLLHSLGVFDRLSMSLLASAGFFTVILGVAAQRVLGDIIAGLQIALTHPVRVGDTIEFEGAWGIVEGITYTHLTIRAWDERRVVVPLQYLMSRPVENMTKTNPSLIKPIYLYVDYHTDVEQVRQTFVAMLEQDEDWDRTTPPMVHVTNITDEAMELRLLCSANNPTTAWYLRFRLSEKMMAYLGDLERGAYLPKQRMLIEHPRHSTRQPHQHDGNRVDTMA